ncbi:hypothetical protein T05_10792 [Trichinella murrelli]|uniref:Uncharacterized protein n=1 Tax=Trichinella murrelli TaxID=144512 RepID=A0A0V0STA9_9BILA|nr:hypothetical protein T05_10792 [Trichinella murrelli]
MAKLLKIVHHSCHFGQCGTGNIVILYAWTK